jgi:NTP pyrophosphatase (non-canonical NTP hydrolase)
LKAQIISDISKEVDKVDGGKYGRPYSSFHEFYGVLCEEVDEVWDEIKQKDQDTEKIYRELVQVVSVCYRMMRNIK